MYSIAIQVLLEKLSLDRLYIVRPEKLFSAGHVKNHIFHCNTSPNNKEVYLLVLYSPISLSEKLCISVFSHKCSFSFFPRLTCFELHRSIHSVRALKRYMNEKNLIHCGEIETIWKFIVQNFQRYFNFDFCNLKKRLRENLNHNKNETNVVEPIRSVEDRQCRSA